MKKLFLLLVLLGCGSEEQVFITAPILPRATPNTTPYRHPSFVKDTTWNEDDVGMTMVYESKSFAQPWFHTIVTDTLEAVRRGWKAQRFEVRPGDCYGTDCTRSPVYERNEFAQAANENVEGDEYWYAWSFYVPANVPEASWVFMGQFQQRSNWDSIWMFMKRSGQPFCAIFDWNKNKRWDCNGLHGTYPLIEDYNFLGKWHDVLVHAKWTQQDNGFTEIYIDGELVVNYKGYTRTAGNHDVYFKYGIYRHGSNQTSVVYYDEIRRGKTRNEVDIRLLEK